MPNRVHTTQEKIAAVRKVHRALLVTGSNSWAGVAAEYGVNPRTLRKWSRDMPMLLARDQDERGSFRARPTRERMQRRKERRRLAQKARAFFAMGFEIAEVAEQLRISRWRLMDILQNDFLDDIRRKAEVKRPPVYRKNIRRFRPRWPFHLQLHKRVSEMEEPGAVTEIYEQLKAEYPKTTLHQRLLMQDIARHSYIARLALEQIERTELHWMAGYSGTEEHLFAWTKCYQYSAEKMRLNLKLLGVKLGKRSKAGRVTKPRAGKVKLSGE